MCFFGGNKQPEFKPQPLPEPPPPPPPPEPTAKTPETKEEPRKKKKSSLRFDISSSNPGVSGLQIPGGRLNG